MPLLINNQQGAKMVVCCLRLAAAASATTVALVLLAPTAVVAFVTAPGASLLPGAGLRDCARFHCSFNGASRWPVDVSSSSRGSSIPSSRESGSSSSSRDRGRIARGRGVASLRAEVLPEGGVSPCIIKVSWPVCI